MSATQPTSNEQTKLWNGPAGHAWVDAQEVLDQMFQPFEDLLIQAVASRPAHVLDIGCGTGSTTLAAARQIGDQTADQAADPTADHTRARSADHASRCLGIDISEPMIALARIRAEQAGLPADFVVANAQTHAFEPACFDLIISRFGVMFFDDPVQAFANLRHAAKDSAHLRFIAWRSAAENPFMTAAERAAAPLLPNLPDRRSDGPGQFAFANPDRVHTILAQSGWSNIDIHPIDITCAFPEKALYQYMTRLGPVGVMLQSTDEPTRAKVIDVIRTAFEPYVHGQEVRFNAACWQVDARATQGSA